MNDKDFLSEFVRDKYARKLKQRISRQRKLNEKRSKHNEKARNFKRKDG